MTDNKNRAIDNSAAEEHHANGTNNNNTNHHEGKPVPATPLKLYIPDVAQQEKVAPQQPEPQAKTKRKHRDKSDLGDNFVAPDGGWGWLVAVASGVNILVTFAVGQQFGIIFREHMYNLGISSSQLTTIINTQIAISAFTGLLNGPLFRRYTYRQVALFGSFLTFLGLFLAVFSRSFIFYVVSFSCCYGFGRGLTVSASSLAVNTFFKQKRRTATAYQFGVAGLGPIFLPYLATYLLYLYGVEGTVLIFAALSLNTISCSLIYQPVKWHIKKTDGDAEAPMKANSVDERDEEIEAFAEPDTPVLPRANDGWYGSRSSLNTPGSRNRLNTFDKKREAGGGGGGGGGTEMQELRRLNSRDNVNVNGKKRTFSLSESIKEEPSETLLLDEHQQKAAAIVPTQAELDVKEHEERKKLPFLQKVVIFFDLDLLRDFGYVNLAVGITLINFVEVNFAILTPFILSDFGFDAGQIALAMSSLGFCDLVIRFLIPLITAKMHFSNQTFFVFGIIGMCIGRAVLAFTRDFYMMMAVFIWLGLNKAFRTVFWSLIIAGYVPLKRLPAASGLQLLMSGIFSMVCGPLIGVIRDSTNYTFTLQFLNALCIFAILMWLGEGFIRKLRGKARSTSKLDGK